MATPMRAHLSVTLEEQKEFEKLSPFELKDKLIHLAGDASRQSAQTMLNAGRGNPNWIATTPRDAFFTLGTFAIQESKRVWDESDLGGMPQKTGIAKRLSDFVTKNPNAPGVRSDSSGHRICREGIKVQRGCLRSRVDRQHHRGSIPVAGSHAGPCASAWFTNTWPKKCAAADHRPGTFDIFAVEGGTAAMCYIFDSLMVNRLLHRGDKVALALPMFTPYIEVCHLDRFHFDIVEIMQRSFFTDGRHTWQYPDAEIDKLKDPSIKALFFVNPSNPPSVAMRESSMERLAGPDSEQPSGPHRGHR